MISRVQLSAFTLYCGLLAAVTAADPINHNSSRSNRGTVADADAEAIEYGLIAALLGDDDESILEGAEIVLDRYVMGAGDDSDVDWSISDKATCEKNGGVWVETPGLGGFCFMKIEGEPAPPLEPIEVPDEGSPGWDSGSLDEIMSPEKLISAPTTDNAPGEKTTSGVTYDNYEGVKNNDPIPGIDIIVDKDMDEPSSGDAIEYALIVALLGDDTDWLETESLLDEILFGGGDCNDSGKPITPADPGVNADTRESFDKVVRKRPGRTTYSDVTLKSGDTRQSNDKVVRKRPGRTTYPNN